MKLFIHNNIFEEQTLWWNLYSVTIIPVVSEIYLPIQLFFA